MTGVHGDVLDRMADKFVFDPSGCWLWTAARYANGYGVISTESHKGRTKNRAAHRVMYGMLRGPIPTGLDLDHLCRVRHCINPDHLEPVTRLENLLRGEGGPGVNSRKTHCSKGHEFTPENIAPNGGNRRCRTCRDEYNRKYRQGWRPKDDN